MPLQALLPCTAGMPQWPHAFEYFYISLEFLETWLHCDIQGGLHLSVLPLAPKCAPPSTS